MIYGEIPTGLAIIYIIGAYYVGRWAGRVGDGRLDGECAG